MTFQNIITDWKKGTFKPVYWLEGEEPFYIDELTEYAEKKILSEAEAGFNLSIFYGKDADWADVINACRRYPMFSEKQVVLLKEAQQMLPKDLEKLEGYIENPLSSTVLVVGYKEKKLDKRSKFSKTIKAKGELMTSERLRDYQMPEWINGYVASKGLAISAKAVTLLVDHIGEDLSRHKNEIEKLTINLSSRKEITEDDIETYVGISKEYNSFELQHALTQRNLTKCLQIIQYLENNPKAIPLQLLLPTLYSFFSKAYLIFGAGTNNENELAKFLGYPNAFGSYVKDIITCAKNYRQAGVEQALLLLHEYNLKSIGVNNASANSTALLKEMVIKMIN